MSGCALLARRVRPTGQRIHGLVDTTRRVGPWNHRPVDEEILQNEDSAGDIDGAVVIGVGGVQARRGGVVTKSPPR